jgi:kynurenine formamidase
LASDAADWIVNKAPSAVGFDFPEERVTKLKESLAKKIDEHPLPIHNKLLSSGVYLIEHLTNLDRPTRRRFLFAAAPLHVVGAEGTPVRAFAFQD